jgi:RHS repeat-associated protein
MAEQRSYTGSFTNRWKFTGKELDEETGLYYFGARFYNPVTSLWLSVDPLVEQTMSSYGYCYNNPIMLTDPDGKCVVIRDADGNVIATYCGDSSTLSDEAKANPFVKNVIDAYNIQKGIGDGNWEFTRLVERPEKMDIYESSNGVNKFRTEYEQNNANLGKEKIDGYDTTIYTIDLKNSSVLWDPSSGMGVTNGGEKGKITGYQTPLESLEHEAAHANGALDDRRAFQIRRQTPEKNTTAEEVRAVSLETKFVKANGGNNNHIRKEYKDASWVNFKMNSINSRKRQSKNSKKQG